MASMATAGGSTGARLGPWSAVGAALALLAAGGLAGCGRAATAAPVPPSTPGFAVTPASGPPGTVVTVTGYVAAMRSATPAERAQAQYGGELAFGGFAEGLDISPNRVHWSRSHPGHFSATFQVPQTGWITPKGPRRLVPGPVTVALRCFGPLVPGTKCGLSPDQAHATFDLTGPIPASPAQAYLRFAPAGAAPGQSVAVTGWAPLTNIIGQPYGYELQWGSAASPQVATIHQSLTGQLSGHFRVPAYVGLKPTVAGPVSLTLSYMFLGHPTHTAAPGAKALPPMATLAPTPFRVLAGLTWAQVHSAPVRLTAAPAPLAVTSLTQVAVASRVLMAGPPGALKAVPLKGIRREAVKLGYPVAGGSPGVGSVKTLAAFPSSLFVAVGTSQPQYGGGPPIFSSPFYSTDGGASWHAAPIPAGMAFGDFAGYRAQGARMYALWEKGPATATEVTANGGASWAASPLGCPTAGPCLVLGPGPTAYAGMGTPLLQDIWRQTAAHHWVVSAQDQINTAPLQLVGLANGTALRIDAGTSYPVELTTNRGRTWQNIALPTPPQDQGAGWVYQTLLMLPNGALLGSVTSPTGAASWQLLPPGAREWRAIPASVLPPGATWPTAAHGRLWWYTTGSGPTATAPTVASASLGSL